MTGPRLDRINSLALEHGAVEVLLRCGPENYKWTLWPKDYERVLHVWEHKTTDCFELLSGGRIVLCGADIVFVAEWTAAESKTRWEEFVAEEEHKSLTGRDT